MDDAMDRILRYERHVERRLYRAMDQLGRLQRRRRGESLLLAFEVGDWSVLGRSLRNKANKCFIFNVSFR